MIYSRLTHSCFFISVHWNNFLCSSQEIHTLRVYQTEHCYRSVVTQVKPQIHSRCKLRCLLVAHRLISDVHENCPAIFSSRDNHDESIKFLFTAKHEYSSATVQGEWIVVARKGDVTTSKQFSNVKCLYKKTKSEALGHFIEKDLQVASLCHERSNTRGPLQPTPTKH